MKKILFGVFCLLSICSYAQAPSDTNVRYGKLDNGLTYYIRHNEQPQKCAEFHIAQNVGAILEEDDQNGLAHFLEHMAFNGTEHFPGKGILTYFESLGCQFGKDINAYTSLDETVYRLSNVPTIREGIIDSALLVLRDWSCAISLLDDEIDAERGVIREEWRTGATAERRIWKKSNELKYVGSQYAKRDIIGDTAVINNFDYDALRRYYKKWYGPDLQAIVVVGDVNVDSIEMKIKKLWNNVPARENRGERPLYGFGDNETPIAVIVTDKEARYTKIQVDFKLHHLPESNDVDNVYFRWFCNTIIVNIINNRFDELVSKSSSPFAYCGSGFDDYKSKKEDVFILLAISKAHKEKDAILSLFEETERLKRYGVTETELDRALVEMLTNMEAYYKERNNQKNITLTQECIRNFIKNECMVGIEKEFELTKYYCNKYPRKELLSLLNNMLHEYIGDKNIIIDVSSPTQVDLPNNEELLQMWNSMKTSNIENVQEEILAKKLVEKKPSTKGVRVQEKSIDESTGAIFWRLSNGARIFFLPTNFKNDQILLYAHSFGGYSHVTNIADIPSAEAMIDIVEQSGLANFSATTLSKMLAGKNVNLSFDIDQSNESIRGMSSVKDFETLLQLNYLYFTAIPRYDEDAFKTLVDTYQTILENRNQNPKEVFVDSCLTTMHNHSNRLNLFNSKFASNINHETALKLFHERFSGIEDFDIVLVGNINPDDKKIKQQILQWIGTIEPESRHEQFLYENALPIYSDTVKNYFTRSMNTKTASNLVMYNGKIEYNLKNQIALEVLQKILFSRYIESIREREGGAYRVGVSTELAKFPDTIATVSVKYDTDPTKQEDLIHIVYQEIQKIIVEGPTEIDFAKSKEMMLKNYEEGMSNNEYILSMFEKQEKTSFPYFKDYKFLVESLTINDIQKILKEIVEQGNLMEVVMMPE